MKRNYRDDDRFDDEGPRGRRDEKDRYQKYKHTVFEYDEDEDDDLDEDYDYNHNYNEFDDR